MTQEQEIKKEELILTQEGPFGIRYDFCDGCRVWVPDGSVWRVMLRDILTDTIVFNSEMKSSGMIQSSKRYYVAFEIVIWKDEEEVFRHSLDLKDRNVCLEMDLGGLGDHIAWIGHAVAFQEKHECRLTCQVAPYIISLFQPVYPHIRFCAKKDVHDRPYYAFYKVLVFFSDTQRNFEVNDYRQVGLLDMAAGILGLTVEERRPDVNVDPGGRPIEEPYVCIATHASGLSKYWNNAHGWYEVIRFLKKSGYRVVCIDRDRVISYSPVIVRTIPHGVEDQTGLRPLSERARWLKHADFFVGLSSGLSWLAWAVKTPVVMISGFTEPFNEFKNPYRVINRHPCHGCANDVRLPFEVQDPLSCPRHKGTEREYECTQIISPKQVMSIIQQIPAFKGMNP